MSGPLVSFVVPCYRLGHYLAECVESILAQSYTNLEVFIMDDCSPDNTPEVARSFQDPRVRYIRNEPNLGHLRNYNKGIALTGGRYVWLISADDRLRRVNAVERYVQLMEADAGINYAFCAGMGLQDERETRVVNSHGPLDRIFKGNDFLLGLLNSNSVVAASGMARRSCYEKISYFPVDMPWAGDWYLWCVFAVNARIAYVSEPLVNYRTHALSMTEQLTSSVPRACKDEELLVYWRVRQEALDSGARKVVNKCGHMIAYHYAAEVFETGLPANLSPCFQDIETRVTHTRAKKDLKAKVFSCLGDRCFHAGDYETAERYYSEACCVRVTAARVRMKRMLVRSGLMGVKARAAVRALRDRVTKESHPARLS